MGTDMSELFDAAIRKEYESTSIDSASRCIHADVLLPWYPACSYAWIYIKPFDNIRKSFTRFRTSGRMTIGIATTVPQQEKFRDGTKKFSLELFLPYGIRKPNGTIRGRDDTVRIGWSDKLKNRKALNRIKAGNTVGFTASGYLISEFEDEDKDNIHINEWNNFTNQRDSIAAYELLRTWARIEKGEILTPWHELPSDTIAKLRISTHTQAFGEKYYEMFQRYADLPVEMKSVPPISQGSDLFEDPIDGFELFTDFVETISRHRGFTSLRARAEYDSPELGSGRCLYTEEYGKTETEQRYAPGWI